MQRDVTFYFLLNDRHLTRKINLTPFSNCSVHCIHIIKNSATKLCNGNSSQCITFLIKVFSWFQISLKNSLEPSFVFPFGVIQGLLFNKAVVFATLLIICACIFSEQTELNFIMRAHLIK